MAKAALTSNHSPRPVAARRNLLQIRAGGVCHTDWDSAGWGRPLLLGHEGAAPSSRSAKASRPAAPATVSCLTAPSLAVTASSASAAKANICEKPRHCPGRPLSPHRRLPLRANPRPPHDRPLHRSSRPGPLQRFLLPRQHGHARPRSPRRRPPPSRRRPFEVGAILGCAVMTGFGSAVNTAFPIDTELFEWDKLYLNRLYGGCRPPARLPPPARALSHRPAPARSHGHPPLFPDRLAQAFADMHAGINSKGLSSFEPRRCPPVNFPTLELSDPALEHKKLRLATVRSPALGHRAYVMFWIPTAPPPPNRHPPHPSSRRLRQPLGLVRQVCCPPLCRAAAR